MKGKILQLNTLFSETTMEEFYTVEVAFKVKPELDFSKDVEVKQK